MDTIYSITILDFNNKIFFLQKRPEFSFETALKLVQSIGKSIKANYLQEYIKKQYEFRLMDTIMTPQIKVKVSLLWEVCVIILYSSMIDLHLINLYNQRMIEALYALCKTKKLKIDNLIKRYHEVNRVLEDTVFYLNPKMRIGTKSDITFSGADIQEHCVYFQKYNRAMQTLKTQVYYHSTKDFLKAKGEISYHRSQNDKLNKTKFGINAFMSDTFAFLKNNLLSEFVSIEDYSKSESNLHQLRNVNNDRMNKSDISNKQEKSTVSSIESNKLSTPPSVSPDVLTQPVLSVQYQSNNAIFVESKEKDRQSNQSNKRKVKKTQNTEESIESLKAVDINDVLRSINFNFESNNVITQENTQNKQNNNSNGIFSNDFFNMVQTNNQQTIQNNNEDSSNNAINRSQSQPKKPQSSNNNQAQITQIPNKKYQSPDIRQKKQQILSNEINKEDSIFNFDFLSKNAPKTENQPSIDSNNNQFNFNHIGNKPIQSIDFCNLNLIGFQEDSFDINEIRKQVRCSIIEKGTLICTKGTYTDINYRGQIALELTSNFIIHNKTFLLKVFHPNWVDQTCFNKTMTKSIVSEEDPEKYKLTCRDIKSMQRLLEYSPNLKVIHPRAEFQVTGAFKGEKYKLELICQMNESDCNQMRASQMIITIIAKANNIVISKTNNSNYTIEDKKITYSIRDFHTNQKLFLGIIFKTEDPTFVQIVKVNYRYMDILPSSLNAEFSYLDDQGVNRILDVAKKCMVEISFTP